MSKRMKRVAKCAQLDVKGDNDLTVINYLHDLQDKINAASVQGKTKKYNRLCDLYDELVDGGDVDDLAAMIKADLI